MDFDNPKVYGDTSITDGLVFNLITVKWSWYKIGDVIDVIKVINMTDVMNVINQCK